MKKLFVGLLALLLLAGCGNKDVSLKIDIDTAAKTVVKEDEFKGTSNMDITKLELKYGVDLSNVEEAVFYLPTDSESASMFIIAKAKENQEEDMYDEIDEIVDQYYHSWTDLVYNAEEAAKCEKRHIEKKDGYYICVIANDINAILDIIKK